MFLLLQNLRKMSFFKRICSILLIVFAMNISNSHADIFPPSQRLSFTIEELGYIYRPEMNLFCHIFQFALFPVNTAFGIFCSYVVLKKSTEAMGHYKYLLLNQILWSFLFDSILTIWQPILIFFSQPGMTFSYIRLVTEARFFLSNITFLQN
jgi:hypothetical protein